MSSEEESLLPAAPDAPELDSPFFSDNDTPVDEEKQEAKEKPAPRTGGYDELFGSDNDSSADEATKSEEHDVGLEAERQLRSREGTRSPSPARSGDDPFEDGLFETEPEEFKADFHQLTYFRPVQGSDEKVYLAKLPNFLAVNPKRFSPEGYDEDDDINDIGGVRLAAENTMRWRYIKDEETGALKKQSNASFVRWSDGSMSLLLGEEIFDVTLMSTMDGHEYLMCHHTDSSFLETQSKLTDKMLFRPFTTKGSTHRKLTAAIASRHVKQVRTKLVETNEDPELLKKALEKAERDRRRPPSRRDYTSRRSGSGPRYDRDDEESEDEESRESKRARNRDNDSYEDGTGFVAGDDEVEEMEPRRERRRKTTSSSKRKAKPKESSDSEEDEYDVEDDEPEEPLFEDEEQEQDDEEVDESAATEKEMDNSSTKQSESADMEVSNSDDEEFRVIRKKKAKNFESNEE